LSRSGKKKGVQVKKKKGTKGRNRLGQYRKKKKKKNTPQRLFRKNNNKRKMRKGRSLLFGSG